MTRGLRGWLLLAVLLGLAAVLGSRLPALLRPVLPPPLALPPPPAETAPLPAIDLPPLPGSETLDPALERPPLHRTRRPYEEPAAPQPEAARPAPLEALLWGIVASGDERYAVLARRGASDGVRVRVGDVFEGWTVTRIDDAEIALRRGDRTETIRLAFGPAPDEHPAD